MLILVLKHSIVFIVHHYIFFCMKKSIELFATFLDISHESQMLNLKNNTDNSPWMQLQLFIFYEPPCFAFPKKIFTDEYHPSGYFSLMGTAGW